MKMQEWLQLRREVEKRRKQAEEDWERATDLCQTPVANKAQLVMNECDYEILKLERMKRLKEIEED